MMIDDMVIKDAHSNSDKGNGTRVNDLASPRENTVKRKMQANVVYFGGRTNPEISILSHGSLTTRGLPNPPQSKMNFHATYCKFL